jgi:hypothetical protein
MERVDSYIDRICKHIDGNIKDIEDFREEMKYHLMESIKEAIVEGKNTEESITFAINRFGEENNLEEEIAKEFKISKRLKHNLTKNNKLVGKVDVKMYVLGILFFLISTCFVITISGTQVAAFLSFTSILMILVSIISVIIATKSFEDFVNGLKIIVIKNHNVSVIEMFKSIKIYDLLIRTSVGGGILGFFIGIIAMLGNLRALNEVGPYVAISLLSIVYGVVFAYFIFMPIKFRLENENE